MKDTQKKKKNIIFTKHSISFFAHSQVSGVHGSMPHEHPQFDRLSSIAAQITLSSLKS